MIKRHKRQKSIRILRSSFGAWRHYSSSDGFSNGEAAVTLYAVTLHGYQQQWKMKLRVMRSWFELTVSTRCLVALSVSLEKRLSFLCIKNFFCLWREEVIQSSSQREELGRCIKRKHVAFSHFKSWYWKAFDSATQDTIRRLVTVTRDDESNASNTSSPLVYRSMTESPLPHSSLWGAQQKTQMESFSPPPPAFGLWRHNEEEEEEGFVHS